MNLTQFRHHFRAYLDAGVAVQLVSAPGLGKSETIADAVRSFSERDGFEWGLCTILAAALTPPDVMGYLVPSSAETTNSHGEKETVATSVFTMPPTMLSDTGRPINEYQRGVIFLDEWDKIEPDTKRCLANFILTGTAGQHSVHEGIGFVLASNRPEDRSGSTKEYDFIINRRAELHIRPDVKAWEDWAVRHDVPPLFTAFAVRNAEVVFSGRVPEKQGPYCTPRSLVMSANLMTKGGFIDPRTSQFIGLEDEGTETIVNEMLTGLLGAAATNALLVWARMKTEVPEFDVIVAQPKKAFIPERPDAKMLVCYDMAHRVTVQNTNAVIEYVLRLPKEMQLVFGLAAVKRNAKLLATAAMMDRFIPENQGLIALVAAN